MAPATQVVWAARAPVPRSLSSAAGLELAAGEARLLPWLPFSPFPPGLGPRAPPRRRRPPAMYDRAPRRLPAAPGGRTEQLVGPGSSQVPGPPRRAAGKGGAPAESGRQRRRSSCLAHRPAGAGRAGPCGPSCGAARTFLPWERHLPRFLCFCFALSLKARLAGCGAHACSPSAREGEAGSSRVRGQFGLHGEPLSQKKPNKNSEDGLIRFSSPQTLS